MSLPKVIYNSGGGAVTLQFVRGPVDFDAQWAGRVHDNLSTSGKARERVTENLDILLTFTMPGHVVDGDMPAWGTFLAWALAGGGFTFYPNAALTDNYNCVTDDVDWVKRRVAAKVYSASYQWRILQDGSAPASPDIVLRRFYGV